MKCFPTILTLAALAVSVNRTNAGEWIFYLKAVHQQVHDAYVAKSSSRLWDLIDADTRDGCGVLAYRIKSQYPKLSEKAKATLAEELGVEPTLLPNIRSIDILGSGAFRDLHAYLASDVKPYVRGPGMSSENTRGNAKIVLPLESPREVHYYFSVKNNYTPDYRAHFALPSPSTLNMQEPLPLLPKQDALDAYANACKYFKSGDLEKLFEMMDCLSQSQANHFAERAHAATKRNGPRVEGYLGVNAEMVRKLSGIDLLKLQPFKDKYSYLASDSAVSLEPLVIQRGGKRELTSDFVVTAKVGAESFRTRVVLTARDGKPAYKLRLESPSYMDAFFKN